MYGTRPEAPRTSAASATSGLKALPGCLGMAARGVEARASDETRQQGGFRQVQLACIHSEIELGGPTDPVHGDRSILSHVDAVEVGLQERLFIVAAFQRHRDHGLVELASQRSPPRQEEGPGQLLCQRAPALGKPTLSQIGQRSRGDPSKVEAGVGQEASIFDGENRLDQRLGHVLQSNRDPVLTGRSQESAEINRKTTLPPRSRRLPRVHRDRGIDRALVIDGLDERSDQTVSPRASRRGNASRPAPT